MKNIVSDILPFFLSQVIPTVTMIRTATRTIVPQIAPNSPPTSIPGSGLSPSD